MTVFRPVFRNVTRSPLRGVGEFGPPFPVALAIVYFDFANPADFGDTWLSKGSQAGVQVDISAGSGTPPVWVIDDGLKFGGLGDIVTTGAALPSGSAARSLMARYVVTLPTTSQYICDYGALGTNLTYSMQSSAIAEQLNFITGSNVTITNPTLTADTFASVAYTYAGAGATLPVGTLAYQDGVIAIATATTGVGVPNTTASQLFMGSNISNVTRLLGSISHIIVFDRVITAAEVLEIHNFWNAV